MLPSTIEILRSALKADATITPTERKRIMVLLRAGPEAPKSVPAAPNEPRLIRRAEAARRLGCSLRLVDRLARDGILPKRHLPNRQRAAGFLESDLLAVIEGKPEAPALGLSEKGVCA